MIEIIIVLMIIKAITSAIIFKDIITKIKPKTTDIPVHTFDREISRIYVISLLL